MLVILLITTYTNEFIIDVLLKGYGNENFIYSF